ncbi:MAG: glycosyltransferase [Prochlorococcus marinus CUG1439]|uniref:glycosyltransferase n=1 Tax=Prochlorococcus sp. MIT 1314 TaxID=3096220 RepID=UPI001B23B8DB|nr:glycosyltransferase [Prochlorococcus sp. MIT 1314]MCR8538760.1 glycosyltransferase [Prochlorococcus marinus CUG1439]
MSNTDIIIPFWEGSSSEELNNSLESLKNEISLINKLIIVLDGENSFFKIEIEDMDIKDKILFIYLKNNKGAGNARNIGSTFSDAENLLFLDAGDMFIKDRIAKQNQALKNNYVSVGAIKEVNSLGIKRVKFSSKNIELARKVLPYKNPFNNVTIGIKRTFFNSIGGYGDTRIGEDWILSGKILHKTDKISFEEEIYVLVNIKENFLERRSGAKVYLEIKKSLDKLYELKIIKLRELIISKVIQKISRVYLSKYFLTLIYKLSRKNIKN